MAREIQWHLPLAKAGDVIVLRLVIERGSVIDFALHYQASFDGDELTVLRYDTCDGHLHVHRMWLDPPNDRVTLETARSADYTEAVEAAKEDVLANWKSYRAKMELSR